MPVYEFKCINPVCEYVQMHYFHTYKQVKIEVKCIACGAISERIFSTFHTSPNIFTKVKGLDDTDDLTVGKMVQEKGIPIEYKRKFRERDEQFKKNQRLYKERLKKHKFSPSGSIE